MKLRLKKGLAGLHKKVAIQNLVKKSGGDSSKLIDGINIFVDSILGQHEGQ